MLLRKASRSGNFAGLRKSGALVAFSWGLRGSVIGLKGLFWVAYQRRSQLARIVPSKLSERNETWELLKEVDWNVEDVEQRRRAETV